MPSKRVRLVMGEAKREESMKNPSSAISVTNMDIKVMCGKGGEEKTLIYESIKKSKATNTQNKRNQVLLIQL